MKIDNKQDVINWLKRLKDDHPLSVDECRLQNSDGSMTPEKHKVYTDQVIKNRYQDMIDYLESDELISDEEELYVDEGAEDSHFGLIYTKEKALYLIRELMDEDVDLPEDYKNCSDDDAFEYASHHYSIYRK